MPTAQGSRHEYAYVAEVTYGTTPGSPAMKRIRNTGGGLNLTKEQYQSAEMRADRQLVSHRHGPRQGLGNIPFELSYGAFDDLLESALFGTWTTNVLKAGVTQKAFTIERRFTDIAQYMRYTGCIVNTLSLTIPNTGIVTGEMGIFAKDMTASGTSLGTPTDVATAEPFVSAGGTLNEGGSPIAIVTALSLSLENGVGPNFSVGSNLTRDPSYGKSMVTGSLEAYFEDLVLYNKFLNETISSLSMALTDGTNTLTISLPRIKYTGAEIPVEGEGSVKVSMPFVALRDNTAQTQMSLTRV
jgi:Phage tail tube protein